MRKILFIFILILLFLSLLISCNLESKHTADEWENIQEEKNKLEDNPEPKYTAEEWEEIQKQEQEQQQKQKELEEKLQYEEMIADQMVEYYSRFENYQNYYDKINIILNKYLEINENLWVKLTTTNIITEQHNYAELLNDNYTDMFTDLSVIRLSDFLKDANNHLIEYSTQGKIASLSVLNNNPDKQATSVIIMEKEFSYFFEEIDNVCNNFNKEAEELNIPIPFPDIDKF